MGVIGIEGIVGVIGNVGERYSQVMPRVGRSWFKFDDSLQYLYRRLRIAQHQVRDSQEIQTLGIMRVIAAIV